MASTTESDRPREERAGGVRVEVEDGVAIVTLHRPEARNALDPSMVSGLVDALRRLDEDDAVRAVVLTGTGTAFCAGADLLSLSEVDAPDRPHYRSQDLIPVLINHRKLLIAAVNGVAVGVGATLTLPMDVRLASSSARFAFPFARLGFVPDGASSWFLPRVVGISTALDWMVTGRMVGIDEARAAGLVTSVHDGDVLLDVAREFGRTIARTTSATSVAVTRHLLWQGLGEPSPLRVLDTESRLGDEVRESWDAREGVRSFVERRPPQFRDRVSTNLPPGFSTVHGSDG